MLDDYFSVLLSPATNQIFQLSLVGDYIFFYRKSTFVLVLFLPYTHVGCWSSSRGQTGELATRC